MSARSSATGTVSLPSVGVGSGRGSRVRVVFLDGRDVAGSVVGFNPRQMSFYLHSKEDRDGKTTRAVDFNLVKAVHFLRDDANSASQASFPQSASLVTLRFVDGDLIRGVAQSYGGPRHGIYLVPTELQDVERSYVPITAIRETVSVKKLGEIMTEKGMVTVELVNKALERQQELRTEPIGQILLKQKSISDQQLEQGLERHREMGKRLGEILLELGFIDAEQLAEALKLQQEQRSKRFGEILLELGYATHKMIAQAMAIQYNLPFTDLTTTPVDPELLRIIPLDSVRRLQALPLSLQDEILTIAVSDPSDHAAKDELQAKTSFVVAETVSTPQDIRRAIDRCSQAPAR